MNYPLLTAVKLQQC